MTEPASRPASDARKLRWLVTAGPTAEDIDPVRFISNRSSGRMGYAVAAAAAERGDEVTLVSGPVALDAPAGCELVSVHSARDMYDATLARYEDADIVVMSAAVADFRPKARSEAKISKEDRSEGLVLELERTEDTLAELGRRKTKQLLVGFALEAPVGAGTRVTDEMRSRARRKLRSKRLDAIALNGPAAMRSERSSLSVLVGDDDARDEAAAGDNAEGSDAGESDAGWHDWGEAEKADHARRLVELAARLALR